MARIIVHITCKTLPSFGLDQNSQLMQLCWRGQITHAVCTEQAGEPAVAAEPQADTAADGSVLVAAMASAAATDVFESPVSAASTAMMVQPQLSADSVRLVMPS